MEASKIRGAMTLVQVVTNDTDSARRHLSAVARDRSAAKAGRYHAAADQVKPESKDEAGPARSHVRQQATK